MANVFVGQHLSGQIAHDLMRRDQDLSGVLRFKGDRFDVGIDLAPLLRPVGTDFFGAMSETAFKGFGPTVTSGDIRARAAGMSRALKAA